jgi:hypothetical protein
MIEREYQPPVSSRPQKRPSYQTKENVMGVPRLPTVHAIHRNLRSILKGFPNEIHKWKFSKKNFFLVKHDKVGRKKHLLHMQETGMKKWVWQRLKTDSALASKKGNCGLCEPQHCQPDTYPRYNAKRC